MKRYIHVSVLILLLTTSLWGAAEFFQNSFGVRAVGMGGAFSAMSQGSEVIFYNGSRFDHREPMVSIEKGSLLQMPFYSVSLQHMPRLKSWRLGYVYATESSIPYTTLSSTGYPIDSGSTFSYSTHWVMMGYYRSIKSVDLALRPSMMIDMLEKKQASSFLLDLSIGKQFKNWLSVNVGFNHFLNSGMKWSTGTTDDIESSIQIGTHSSFLNKKWNINTDMTIGSSFTFAVGTEYWLRGQYHQYPGLAVRAGKTHQSTSLGLGVLVDGFMFDYAFVQGFPSYTEHEHRFSVGRQFGVKKSGKPLIPRSRSNLEDKDWTNQDLTSLTPDSLLFTTTDLNPFGGNEPQLVVSTDVIFKDDGLVFTTDQVRDGFYISINGRQLTPFQPVWGQFPLQIVIESIHSNRFSYCTLMSSGNSEIQFSGQLVDNMSLMINRQDVYERVNGFFDHVTPVNKASSEAIQILFSAP